MLTKYYYDGKSNRYNDMFYSPQTGIRYTIPYAIENIRELCENHYDEYNIDIGSYFKRCLYLEKPENSNRFWKVVIGLWCSEDNYTIGCEPDRVIKITTDNFDDFVADKFTGEYVEELPMKCFYQFLNTGYRTFY